MLDSLCRNAGHLEKQLKVKLAKEIDLNIRDWIRLDQKENGLEWLKVVRWMRQVNQHSCFKADTFTMGAYVLDKFLGQVKVHGKYLQCASAASLYLAAKIIEEEPLSLENYVNIVLSNKFTCSDLQRMEIIVLQKIDWCMPQATPNCFLDIYFSMICSKHFETVFGSDNLAYSIFMSLSNQLEMTMCSEMLQKFRGSMLALSLLSCTLEKITSRWFLYIEPLICFSEMNIDEVLSCRDVIKRIIFGVPQTRKIVRQRKAARRRNAIMGNSTLNRFLSPIAENPSLDDDCMKMEVSKSFLEDSLAGVKEDNIECDTPRKRRKLVSCNLQSHKSGFQNSDHNQWQQGQACII
jgi:hypothetical protein